MIFQLGAPCMKAHPVEELDIEDTRLGFKNKNAWSKYSIRIFFFDGLKDFCIRIARIARQFWCVSYLLEREDLFPDRSIESFTSLAPERKTSPELFTKIVERRGPKV